MNTAATYVSLLQKRLILGWDQFVLGARAAPQNLEK